MAIIGSIDDLSSQGTMSKPKIKVEKEKDAADEEPTIEELKKEIEAEQKSKDTVEWSNVELERSVRAMEANVIALESGNPEADDRVAIQ